MRGDILLRALRIVATLPVDAADFFDVMIRLGYGVSMNEFSRELEKRSQDRDRQRSDVLSDQVTKQEKQRVWVLLSHLKRNGLLVEKKHSGKQVFVLTSDGHKKLSDLLEARNKHREFPLIRYGSGKGQSIIVVVFDIPEQEREKRGWLRSALRNIGLEMIQRSVWMGKIKIPKQFIDDIYELRLMRYVHMFEIGENGNFTAAAITE